MQLPDWTPALVRPLLNEIGSAPLSGAGRRIFDRLTNSTRILVVYNELLKRNRTTGRFFHAVKNGDGTPAVQLESIKQILQVVIAAASDGKAVSTPEQIEQTRTGWLEHAERLDFLADNLEQLRENGSFGLTNTEASWLQDSDIESFRKISKFFRMLTTALRRSDDPLMVSRVRRDPVANGVQITIGSKMEELFGQRLDGTAATLTEIALETKATSRASRSALSKEKKPKRRSAQ